MIIRKSKILWSYTFPKGMASVHPCRGRISISIKHTIKIEHKYTNTTERNFKLATAHPFHTHIKLVKLIKGASHAASTVSAFLHG